ncbi:MAG TPA: hypothetical protein VFV49_04605 [Thermoanaerobaculia bacterium]|nr:hypothetical protein [Thermoanaerobaculia bacterium]
MDEDLKRLIVDTGAETRRHFDVVAEGLRHDVKGIADGYLAVSERVDRLAEEMNDRFSDTSAELKLVTQAVARLDKRVGKLETSVARLDTQSVKLEAKVDRVETTVERVISILEADHGVLARLDRLEARR